MTTGNLDAKVIITKGEQIAIWARSLFTDPAELLTFTQ
jgi:hypothetical protein